MDHHDCIWLNHTKVVTFFHLPVKFSQCCLIPVLLMKLSSLSLLLNTNFAKKLVLQLPPSLYD